MYIRVVCMYVYYPNWVGSVCSRPFTYTLHALHDHAVWRRRARVNFVRLARLILRRYTYTTCVYFLYFFCVYMHVLDAPLISTRSTPFYIHEPVPVPVPVPATAIHTVPLICVVARRRASSCYRANFRSEYNNVIDILHGCAKPFDQWQAYFHSAACPTSHGRFCGAWLKSPNIHFKTIRYPHVVWKLSKTRIIIM